MGVIARQIEAAGVATTSISLVREHTEQVKPPRALFVPFPFGYPLGKPDDPDLQLKVLRAAFGLLERERGPVLEDYPDDAFEGQDLNLPQAANVAATSKQDDVAFEVTSLRAHYERWVAEHGGRTNVGLTGVDERRFRGLVRFLEAFARGEEGADMEERKPEISIPQFARYACDDLRSFYFEARLQQKPGADFQDVNRWFWADTAAGNLLRAIRDRLTATNDPALAGIAFGIAR
ncbi:MAG TPA: hypothetical protein VK009_22235 [Chloroflexota bacterium]|nr:hypothetical protein [Chloroflexota bacterium]